MTDADDADPGANLPERPDEIADDEISDDDRRLMLALASAVGHPEASDDLVARCEGLITWIDVDAELATLLEQAPAELAGTRGSSSGPGTGSADLEFAVDDGSCVIELKLGGDALRGLILGVVPGQVSLRVVTGIVAPAPVDDLGAFEFDHPPPGSARIEIELDEGRRIHTDWFVI